MSRIVFTIGLLTIALTTSQTLGQSDHLERERKALEPRLARSSKSEPNCSRSPTV